MRFTKLNVFILIIVVGHSCHYGEKPHAQCLKFHIWSDVKSFGFEKSSSRFLTRLLLSVLLCYGTFFLLLYSSGAKVSLLCSK